MNRELEHSDVLQFWRQPAWQALPASERARLLAKVKLRHLDAGDTLFLPQQSAAQLFLIREGSLTITRQQQADERQGGFVGEECVLGSADYCSTATATVPSTVYTLPAAVVQPLVNRYPALKAALFGSYACLPDSTLSPTPAPTSTSSEVGLWRQLLGWLTAMGLPLLLWQLCMLGGLPTDTGYFISILGSTAAMWIFALTPAFVPALFALLAIILFDVAPASIATAGFSSNGFFMLLSVFAIGALMTLSGLTYRISLAILKRVPATTAWYNASLFLYGLLLTPIMPSQLGRASIVAPFLATLLESRGEARGGSSAARLLSSAIAGISLAAAVFLTGKPANLVVFGLFDQQTQYAFEWLPWLCAASFSGVLLLLFHFVVSHLLFRDAPHFGISNQLLHFQMDALGPMSRKEWSAVAAISLIMAGMLSSSLHQVDIPWLSLGILVVLLLFGVIGNEELNRQVDWSVLIFIGSIITWVPIMNLTGIDARIAATFGGLGSFMKTQLPSFIALLCLAIVLIRLVLPELVAEILLLTLLLPLAHNVGVSQWLIGFVVLTMCEAYILPYQAPYHLLLQQQLHNETAPQARRVMHYSLAMTAARMAVIFLSFPFWSALDII